LDLLPGTDIDDMGLQRTLLERRLKERICSSDNSSWTPTCKELF